MSDIEALVATAIDCGLHVHRGLGPGLLESVYEAVLADVLRRRGLFVERQKALPIVFEGRTYDEGFRLDLLVEQTLVIELKSTESFSPFHAKQVLTYLRMIEQPVGLLMNFGMPTFRDGLRRLVNHPPGTSSSFAPSRLRASTPSSSESLGR